MTKKIIQATAFILIGGKSERFGRPKWRVVIDDKIILDRIWKSCEHFRYRYVIGKSQPNRLDKPFLSDKLKFQAPINGLYTALNYANTDWVMLLSCDLPLIDAEIFIKLWETKDKTMDAIIPFANNRHQVTCAFYHKRVIPNVLTAIQANDYSLYKLLDNLNSTDVIFNDDIRFWNMNTEQDFQDIVNSIT